MIFIKYNLNVNFIYNLLRLKTTRVLIFFSVPYQLTSGFQMKKKKKKLLYCYSIRKHRVLLSAYLVFL